MPAGALGTYASALIVIAASVAIGAGILAGSGRRTWSWTAPAVGLAAATVIAWWTVRLPGHGVTALAALVVASLLGAGFALRSLDDPPAALVRGGPAAAVALLAVSLPFAFEGHFGILGTGFNVDMSQHLFVADWLSDPRSTAPSLFEQGYPLGPHALAVATGEVSGELATAFSGVTIAVPVIVALTALAAVQDLSTGRATAVAALTAFAYLGASYLAQGAFKELFEIAFLLGFALWLGTLRLHAEGGRAWRLVLPGAVLAAGTLYAYSGPGLAWIGGTLALWAAVELFRRRPAAGSALRAALPAATAGAVVLVLLAAPELDRIIDFGPSVGTVSERAEADAGPPPMLAQAEGEVVLPAPAERPEFDNDLGNLFGQINPLEAFGIWPSGDFRVAPGEGAVPAIAFYLGTALGAMALAFGIAASARRGETAILAALAAAAAIWLVARAASTPYTAAKALALVAPLAMLVATRGVLEPAWLDRARGAARLGRAALAAAFAAAAAISGGLALASAPVGPGEYSAGVGNLANRFGGRATLLVYSGQPRADEFYGWELREAAPACVVQASATDEAEVAPEGFRFVLTTNGARLAPFSDLQKVVRSDGVTLWEPREPPTPPAEATVCPELGG